MYLAKYNNKMVLASADMYSEIESFKWETFKWPEKVPENQKRMPNFPLTLDTCPINPSAKIICVGRNYVEHAKELGNTVPNEPLLFLKPSSALLVPQGKILLPKMSQKIEHETELVVVIGKKGQNIPEDKAMDYVLGYSIGLDITARDLQNADKTWFRAKGFDTFAPVGPWIISPENINLDNCPIELFINGQLRQKGNTHDMVFKLPYLIHYTSQVVTLEAGDIIFTGTPEGIGPIRSGDELCAKIGSIGELNVTVA